MDETTSWPCPNCGEDIPDTQMGTRLGMVRSDQPLRQHVTCPNCDAELERQPEAQPLIEHLQAWYPAGMPPNAPGS